MQRLREAVKRWIFLYMLLYKINHLLNFVIPLIHKPSPPSNRIILNYNHDNLYMSCNK